MAKHSRDCTFFVGSEYVEWIVIEVVFLLIYSIIYTFFQSILELKCIFLYFFW